MISKSLLMSYKVANAPKDIIHISFKSKDYIFRTITNKEYEDIIKIAEDDYEKDELICQVALLYPSIDSYDFSECGLAGFPDNVAPIILDTSKVLNANALQYKLEDERVFVNNLYSQAFLAIKLSFPEITLEQYENMDWNEVIRYVALSEKMIQYKQLIDQGVPFNLNIVEPVSEDEEQPTEEEIKEMEEEAIKQQQLDRENLFEFMYENGIDAVDYFNLPLVNKGNVVEKPIIGGINWQDEGIINEIGKKITTTRK